jgi:hypothetical protein
MECQAMLYIFFIAPNRRQKKTRRGGLDVRASGRLYGDAAGARVADTIC